MRDPERKALYTVCLVFFYLPTLMFDFFQSQLINEETAGSVNIIRNR